MNALTILEKNVTYKLCGKVACTTRIQKSCTGILPITSLPEHIALDQNSYAIQMILWF